MTPAERLEKQAAWCRRRYRAMSPDDRLRLAEKIGGGDAFDRAWAALLRGSHPLLPWLESAALVADAPDVGLPNARQLVSSHPFAVEQPWSSPAT